MGGSKVLLGKKCLGKSSQNSSIGLRVLICWGSYHKKYYTTCTYLFYTLPKVVNSYDLSVLSTSVMGLQKRLDMGLVGCALSIFFGGFLEFFNFASSLKYLIQTRFLQTCVT